MADETRAKVVYFVRHGQSKDNVAPVFQLIDTGQFQWLAHGVSVAQYAVSLKLSPGI